ncbi:hypothetical protein HMPREF0577_0045 [Mobiluncus mulieris ATCC 35243]|nr:hypothetical protein HMPREF0577_0045 [Mobiluncus mulieris ATCC 35243]
MSLGLLSKGKPGFDFESSFGCFGGFMRCLPGIRGVVLGEIP